MVEEAARTPDRAKRMAMYRQADRQLVHDQALVLVLNYYFGILLVKPWVKNYSVSLLGITNFQDILMEDH